MDFSIVDKRPTGHHELSSGSRILYRIAAILFILTTGFLFILSLFFHVDTNIQEYSMPRTVVRHTPWLYFILVFFLFLVLSFVLKTTEHLTRVRISAERYVRITITIGMCLVGCLGIAWILFNDSLPRYDQQIVFNEARLIVGFSDGNFNYDYYSTFPRQKGITLTIALALRLFGDSQLSFRIFNVIGSVLLYLGVCMSAWQLMKKPSYVLDTAILMIFFYPIVAYTAFIYGTELSMMFSVWGIYETIRFREAGRIRNAVEMSLCFALGILMHQVALIALIAAVVYLLISIKKKVVWKTILACVVSIMVTSFTLLIVNKVYTGITNLSYGDSCPPSAVVLMGITSEDADGGPGAIDGSYGKLFNENNRNSAKTNKAALKQIQTVICEYLKGQRDPSFFLRKIEYEWLEPTMSSRKIIMMNDLNQGEPKNSERFTSFYWSSMRSYIDKLSVVFMIYVYFFSFISGIVSFLRPEKHRFLFLIEIYFLGGFMFQMMWETLSRYCLPYYLWLVPTALIGQYEVNHVKHGRRLYT